jgi:hypothetical protein
MAHSNCSALMKQVVRCHANESREQCLKRANIHEQPFSCDEGHLALCENDGYSRRFYGCTRSTAKHEQVHVMPTVGSPSWIIPTQAT